MHGPIIKKVISTYIDYLFYLFLIISTSIVYFQTTSHDFVNLDDFLQLTKNSHVLSGFTWENLWFALSPKSECSLLTWFSYTSTNAMFGLHPGVFHLMSLVLHITNSMLLFSLLKNMTGKFWQSSFVGALFALHPINVESVAWVAELNNVLSGLFFMLTVLAYYFYTKLATWKRYIPALFLFELGLLAKPVLMTLPFILLLLDLWPLKRITIERKEVNCNLWRLRLSGVPISRIILEKIPFMILSLVSLINLSISVNSRMGFTNLEIIPFSQRILYAFATWVKYLGKLFWPLNLAVIYPFPSRIVWWQLAGSGLLLVSVTILALRLLYHSPYFFVGWFWFLGGLVPFLGIIQAGLWCNIQDRYAYLTYIGIFIVLSWGIPDLLARWRYYRTAIAIAGSAVIFGLSLLTWVQVGYWKDSISLFRHVLAVTTDISHVFNKSGFAIAHNNLGIALFDKGDSQGATSHFRQAIDIYPYYADPYFNLGNISAQQKHYEEAAQQYLMCMKINPQKVEAYTKIGFIMAATGNYDEAIKYYAEALQRDPHQGLVYYCLGNVYIEKGNMSKAIEYFKATIRENPGYLDATNQLIKKAMMVQKNIDALILSTQERIKAEPKNPFMHKKLGDILRQQAKYDEAIDQYQKATAINPNFIQAMYGLVLVYSDLHNYSKALDLLQNIRQEQPDNPEVYYNIACIYAKQNMTKESIGWLNQAIDKGFKNWDQIKKDPDLASIRNTAFINELIKNH